MTGHRHPKSLAAPGKDFDVLVLGGGIGGLATAAQLATAGARVGVVERHDVLGGYAHALKVGDFDFCHQVHYLMGCEESGPVPRFLGRLGLRRDVGFNYMSPDGYDVVVTPELRFAIPSGSEAFAERLAVRFPAHQKAIRKYFAKTQRIFAESRPYDRILHWSDVARAPWKHIETMRHMRLTTGQVFDELGLPPEIRLILAARSGNLSASPAEASFLMQTGMQEAYARSAAYPKLGMRDMVARIAQVIENAPGCRIFRSCAVKRILTSGRTVDGIDTDAGRLTAGTYISNIDPQLTYALTPEGRRLNYAYSDAVVSLNIGFKNVNLRDHGFGRHNYWFHSHADLDREFFDLTKRHLYSDPWVFLSTPSLLTDPGVLCDARSSTLVMLTFVNHARIEELERQGGTALADAMAAVEEAFWRILEKHFLKDARRLATAKHLETPLEVRQRLAPAQANVYGARLTPASYNMRRVTSRSAYGNLRFANATAFYPGVMAILVGSMQLVDELLGSALPERGA